MESHDPLAVSFDAEVQDMCILSHEGRNRHLVRPFKKKMFDTYDEAVKLCKAFNHAYNHKGLLIL
jgi:hypothetical protein